MTDSIPERLRASAASRVGVLLLAAVLVTAAGWAWAAWSVPGPDRAPSLVVGAASILLLVVVGAGLLYQAEQRGRAAARVDALRAETRRLSADLVPALVGRLREGVSAATALDGVDLPEDPGCRAALEAVADEIARSERRRLAVMATGATAAGRVQALTTAMLADLREMQDRHGNGMPAADVLGDLMHLDHSTAQTGRIADSIAVLAGARSGRRWTRPIPMESVLRGAMGRIGAYQRVRTYSTSGVAVVGYAAEGVMHALAEILDNATKFSPPTAEVHVYVEEVQAGVAVIVEDGGLVMGEDALRRARRMVENDLDPEMPSGTRLGLVVVGALARKYGLSVSFRSSARGGTSVVTLLPQRLVKPLPAPREEPDAAPRALAAAAAPPRAGAGAGEAAREGERGESGLPVRRRGQALAEAERTRTASRDTPRAAPRPGPATPAQGFGAFRSAVRKPISQSTPEDES
ncbi:sensor histidine kinase [Actinorugispora endophytica]|uniref:histidine kinase n=1 Tax=Actinorugispora endophytica TaxID=1605990 RepID=A0A4R6V4H3_9ACTN|nr:ATP-binding protein [Actinorugispora endophytica]TDQ53129.1 histidine kinase/DNA gyrase B/HSP90-like ATPase [Actinorugispora endophytica]